MSVYLDILIFENFIVDFFLLCITCQSLRIKINFKLCSLAAIIGSIYSVLVLYPLGKYLSSIPIKILFVFLMISIAVKKRNIEVILKGGILFVLYSFLLGGVCIFISLSKGDFDYADNIIINFTYKKLLLALMIIYILISRLIIFIRDRKIIEKLIYTIDINVDNSRKSFRAFLDTGNELREPITNLPVIIVYEKTLRDINIETKEKLNIPFKVLNGKYGMLNGFIPDNIVIHYDDKKEKNIKAVIAVSDKKLSELDEYSALLSRDIIF